MSHGGGRTPVRRSSSVAQLRCERRRSTAPTAEQRERREPDERRGPEEQREAVPDRPHQPQHDEHDHGDRDQRRVDPPQASHRRDSTSSGAPAMPRPASGRSRTRNQSLMSLRNGGAQGQLGSMRQTPSDAGISLRVLHCAACPPRSVAARSRARGQLRCGPSPRATLAHRVPRAAASTAATGLIHRCLPSIARSLSLSGCCREEQRGAHRCRSQANVRCIAPQSNVVGSDACFVDTTAGCRPWSDTRGRGSIRRLQSPARPGQLGSNGAARTSAGAGGAKRSRRRARPGSRPKQSEISPFSVADAHDHPLSGDLQTPHPMSVLVRTRRELGRPPEFRDQDVVKNDAVGFCLQGRATAELAGTFGVVKSDMCVGRLRIVVGRGTNASLSGASRAKARKSLRSRSRVMKSRDRGPSPSEGSAARGTDRGRPRDDRGRL